MTTTYKALGLPALPGPLKSLAPFLQRAEELRAQEPIMSYWCAYHAAQVGISLKSREILSRDFLLHLLELLEHMKKDIGQNDAIDMEAASAAYVENFALKIFGMADNEDRSGRATRSTAKKFLAAANFLEVLKVFPQSEVSDSNEEKIRYAKWKAADISKAFREGRKPTAGPAGSDPEGLDEKSPSSPSASTSASTATVSSTSPPLTPTTAKTSPPTTLKRFTPSPELDQDDIRRANASFLPRSSPPRLPSEKNVTPGRWSTAATPGGFSPSTEEPRSHNGGWTDGAPPDGKARERSESVGTIHARKPSLSEEMEGHDAFRNTHDESSNSFVAPEHPRQVSRHGRHSVSPPRHHPEFTESIAPHQDLGVVPPAGSIPVINGFTQLPPAPVPHPMALPDAPPIFELTPAVIAKAQKHCRFAISALDYEDAETARTQLRQALAALGG